MYPALMKVLSDRAGDRILELGKALFNVSTIDETIENLTSFFITLGSPVTCKDAGIDDSKKAEILSLMNENNTEGQNFKLSDAERKSVIDCI